jgi:hypothetical protein
MSKPSIAIVPEQAGQTLAVDVQGEYVVFVQLSETREIAP